MKHPTAVTGPLKSPQAKKEPRTKRPDNNRPAPMAQSRAPSAEREEAIRAMAYHFYEARGRIDGYAQEDWQNAESQFDQQSVVDAAQAAKPSH